MVMVRFLERTWAATLVVVFAASAVAAFFTGPAWTLVVGTTALLTTPIVWWALVGRRKKPGIGWGFLAGGFLGGAAHVLYVLPGLIWTYGLNRDQLPKDIGLGGLPILIMVGMILYCAVITSAICALAGLVIVIVERRGQNAREQSWLAASSNYPRG